jgi:acyl transferase domain-containing protein
MAELFKDEHTSIVDLPHISQPLCTALQLALVDLLNIWNIEPRAVLGHSSGEIAAAYALGAISRDDCLKLAFHRGRLTSEMKHLEPSLKGRMMAVALSTAAAENYIKSLKCGAAVVACINSPENVTVSGDESAILELEKILADDGLFARLLRVENAYHSSHMKIIEKQYLLAVQDIQILEAMPGRHMFSSVTGGKIEVLQLGPEYWARNLVSPVNFLDAITSLLSSKIVKPDAMLELGPHGVLQAPIKQILDLDIKPRSRPTCVSMLHRGKDAIATALEAIGHLWSQGCPVNMEMVNKR